MAKQRDSINLISDGMVMTATRTIGDAAPIPLDMRRAIIVDKCKGDSAAIIALRYGVSEGSVSTIYREFIRSADNVRCLADQNPEEFKTSIRRKAVSAIEAGLECDRDPYRQAAVGLKVMTGIGEFKSDNASPTVTINNMIASMPGDWKDRYIGIDESGSSSTTSKDQGKGE